MKTLIFSALLMSTAHAQIVIYTDQYGQPAGSAFVQGNMQPPVNQQPNYQAVQRSIALPPPYNPEPSVRSPYYINPQGANNEQRR